jgi:membrane-associated protease RseP (regulator of RpoE activity)
MNGRAQNNAVTRPRLILPRVLLIATIITTMTAGALYIGADVLKNPYSIFRGLPFSASLLFILGTHELGHFIASRRHGVATTWPMFIPGPPIPPMIGTFGAVIKIKSPITTKDALIDIGSAGPLSGFVAAFVVTIIGLAYSSVIPAPKLGNSLGLGTSLIFQFLSFITIGPVKDGFELMLHPVAFAGWIGFFVTAMNLLPIGQLDGGHIVYAVIGAKHRIFSFIMVGVLILLGIFAWPGWILWAALIALVAMYHPPISDPRAPIDKRRKLTAALSFTAFVLTFMPTPFYIV